MNYMISSKSNIIRNHDFSQGLRYWQPIYCAGFVRSASAKSGDNYAVITNRKKEYHGLEQDITSRVSSGSSYTVSACVGVSQGTAHVKAMLKLEYRDSAAQHMFVGSTFVCEGKWGMLEGTFSLPMKPERVLLYFDGPSPGVDLLIDSAEITLSSPSPREAESKSMTKSRSNIILNHDFSQGLNSWHPNSCVGFVCSAKSGYTEGIVAKSGESYAVITNRKEKWQGLKQDITDRVSIGSIYTISAYVGVSKGSSRVEAKLELKEGDAPGTRCSSIGSTYVSRGEWGMLRGKFPLNMRMPGRVVFHFCGASPGVDILIDSAFITLDSPSESEKICTGYVASGDKMLIDIHSSSSSSLSSSFTSIPQSNYEVFLSFRGEDTRHNFTNDLYKALIVEKIQTFRDDSNLERGGVIAEELLKAIERSKISIVIFSQNYANSRWCLGELVKIMECCETKRQRVLPVFYYVNPSDVRKHKGLFGELNADHIEDSEKRMEMIKSWKEALTKASNISGWHLKEEPDAQRFRRSYEREYIEKIRDEVSKILNHFNVGAA